MSAASDVHAGLWKSGSRRLRIGRSAIFPAVPIYRTCAAVSVDVVLFGEGLAQVGDREAGLLGGPD
ncbi:hypothetical protein, partial [Shumkonia mesophila]|uniref:hypothetical protein n=1 Tax=Shumkonia mesophila TaxID=2838854 RepID=UPI0029346713